MKNIGPVEIVVTHLTRMHNGNICVAGIDPLTGAHIRPVTGRGIPRAFLRRPGGVIEIGSILNFRTIRPIPNAPELEDHLFPEADCDVVGEVGEHDVWKLLESTAKMLLGDIFGHTFQRSGHTGGLEVGSGAASLGVLRPRHVDGPFVDGYGKVRVHFDDDGGMPMTVPVTDLRLYGVDDGEPDRLAVDRLRRRVEARSSLLAVGVGRPFHPPGKPELHWLQVNNIHVQRMKP